MAGEIPQSEAIELLVIENAKLVKEIAELKALIKTSADTIETMRVLIDSVADED